MNGGFEAGVGFIVAGCDTPELFNLLEVVFDQMAPCVHLGIVGDGVGAAGAGRDHRQSTALVQLKAQPVAVEGLVADERANGNAVKQLYRFNRLYNRNRIR